MVLPLPPSDNEIYSTTIIRKGKLIIPKRQLTAIARAYKTNAKQKVAKLFLTNSLEFKKNIEYSCLIHVFFKKIYNKGWPGAAKNRYKREDAQDRIKLATDAISEAIGVDDSHHFRTVIEKEEDKDNPRMEITIFERNANE